MNAFLAETKAIYQNILLNPRHYNKLRVVLGNETCDLDSAISALVYGFVLHHEGIEDGTLYKSAVLPLMNIPHDDLPLKTEVIYFLKSNDIKLDWVPTRGFRDLLDLDKIKDSGNLELTLVDHHTLCSFDENLRDAVVEVIDHRPQHPDWNWHNISNVVIKNVGSCCTLVTERIKQRSPHLITKEIAKLLLGPILLDTVNLSKTAGRATQLDEEMVQYLESTATVNQEELYTNLVNAKSDIGKLSTSQVLRKDMKIIGGVPMLGVPILIQDFKNRHDFEESVSHFSRLLNDVPLIILMGVWIQGETVKRDLALFGKEDVSSKVLNALETSTEPSLGLAELEGHGIAHLRLFSQSNVKATRKHIGPIIAKIAPQIVAIKRYS